LPVNDQLADLELVSSDTVIVSFSFLLDLAMPIKKLNYKDHSVWLTVRDTPVHGDGDDDYEYPRHASRAIDLHNIKRNGIYVNCHVVSEAGKVKRM
jgi:hypothetical protein